MAKILYLHGSGTTAMNNNKAVRLMEAGHDVRCRADLPYPADWSVAGVVRLGNGPFVWFGKCVELAQATFDDFRPDVIVGSSMGGAVAMNLRAGGTPKVLIAPAWKAMGMIRFGDAEAVTPRTAIIHGERDKLVFPAACIELLGDSPPDPDLERRLAARLGGVRGLRVEGRRITVLGDDHRCNSEPGHLAMLGAVDVMLEGKP